MTTPAMHRISPILGSSTPNPVVTRLTGRSRWPSLRACFWLAFGVGLASTAFSAMHFLDARESHEQGGIIPFLLMGFTLISPGTMLLVAALLTVLDLRRDTDELLLVTGLSNGDIVRGYVVAMLRRTRIQLLLIVVIMPVILIGQLETQVQSSSLSCALTLRYFPSDLPAGCELPSTAGVLMWMTVSIWAWGQHWLAVVVGVALALWWRNPLPGIIVSLAFIIGGVYVLVLTVIVSERDLSASAWGIAILWMLAPFVLSPLIMRFSERWVRRGR